MRKINQQQMLSVTEAQSIILSQIKPLDANQDREIINLDAANHRILATPVTSKLDFPHWDNSAMDGYAVRFADVQDCTPQKPTNLEVVAEITAGCNPQTAINTGEAARIFTGAIIPPGADTVVMQEKTKRQGNQVQILESPPQSKNFVRQQAAYYQAGNTLLSPGIALNAPEIAVLAAAQCTELAVYRRPRVAIFSTGDELVKPEETLQPGQIIDSNQYALATLVRQWGGIPLLLGIVPDQPEKLKETIASALEEADFVLSTGGVSVGDYDYVEQILGELGGKILVQSVAVKPGKPLTFATFPNSVYFGIPGNPVSALVSCWRFVQPAFKKFSGLKSSWLPTFVKAQTKQELRAGGKRETYLWGRVEIVNGGYEFILAYGGHSSGNLINLAQTNALAIVPVGESVIAEGMQVDVMLVS